MASFSAAFSVGPKTLTGTTVDQVTLTNGFRYVDVHNLSGTADLTVTFSRSGSAPSDPVAAASDNYVIPAGRTRTLDVSQGGATSSATTIVKVLGNGNSYLVEGTG